MAGVPLLEDLRVTSQPVDLLAQRLHLAFVAKRMPQEVAQGGEEAPGRARVLGDQPGDRVERVEQEVRLEVRAEPRELDGGAKLARLQGAKARVIEREGEDEGERPEAEV